MHVCYGTIFMLELTQGQSSGMTLTQVFDVGRDVQSLVNRAKLLAQDVVEESHLRVASVEKSDQTRSEVADPYKCQTTKRAMPPSRILPERPDTDRERGVANAHARPASVLHLS